MNGQKGINNNISVDGADFNNPFFGEQRGGQRRPSPSARTPSRRWSSWPTGPPRVRPQRRRLHQRVTKSGTNAAGGTAHFFFKADGLSSENADGREIPVRSQQYGATFGGPLKKDKLFFFLAYDEQQFDQTKQLNPNRIEAQVVNYLASVGSPAENGPIDRTNDARVFLGKGGLPGEPGEPVQHPRQLHVERAAERHVRRRLWGRSANAVERSTPTPLGSLATTLSGTCSTSSASSTHARWATSVRRPAHHRAVTAAPGHRFDLGSGYRVGMPFFIPVEYNDTRFQIVDNLSWVKGRHTLKAGFEFNRVNSSQTFIGFANGRYVFGSTAGSSTTRSSARKTSSVPTAPQA